MAFTQVPIAGVIHLPDESPAAGALVTFTLNSAITDGAKLVSTQPVTAVCDSTGAFAVTLNANDDTTTSPSGTFYNVLISPANKPWVTLDDFNVTVPKAGSAGVELFSLIQLINPTLLGPSAVTVPPGMTAGDLLMAASSTVVLRLPAGSPHQHMAVRPDGTLGYADREINLNGWKDQYPNLGNGSSSAQDTAAIQAWATAVIASGGHGVAPPPSASNYLIQSTINLVPAPGQTGCEFSMEWLGGAAKTVKSFIGSGTDAARSIMFNCAGWKETTRVKGLCGSVVSATNTVMFEIDNPCTSMGATYASGQAAGTSIQVATTARLVVGQSLTLSFNTANAENLVVASIVDATHVTFGGATTTTHTSGDLVCSLYASFSQCTLEDCEFFVNNQAGMLAVRIGHTDNTATSGSGADFSFINFTNFGIDASAATGNGDSTGIIGFALESNNCLNNYWYGGFAYNCDKNFTTSPTTGAANTSIQTRASLNVYGFGSAGNGFCDYEITAIGSCRVVGGRSERGAGRFCIIGASAGSTVPIVASFDGVEIADYNGLSGVLFQVQGASSLILNGVYVGTTAANPTHAQFTAAMITATNTTTAPGAITVRGSTICASDPFYTVSGLYYIRNTDNVQTSTPWPSTAVGVFFDPNAFSSVAVPVKSGFFFHPAYSLSNVATLGNGTLRAVPFLLTEPITITAMTGEFTAAGDAASVLATAIFADNGSGQPGKLLVTGPTISTGTGNAGTVSTGGTPGAYQGAPSGGNQQLPAGLYHAAGVVQGVTVTQPTIRCAIWGPAPLSSATVQSSATPSSYQNTAAVTGALPSTFTGSGSPGNTTAPKVGFKVL